MPGRLRPSRSRGADATRLRSAVDGGADAGQGRAHDLFAVADGPARRAEPAPGGSPTSRSPAAGQGRPGPRQIFGGSSAPRRSTSWPRPPVGAGPRPATWATPSSTSASSRSSGAAEADGQADTLEDELFPFERIVPTPPTLRDALSDPPRSVERQARLLRGPARGQGRRGHHPARRAGGRRHPPHGRRSRSRTYQKVAASRRERLVATGPGGPRRSASPTAEQRLRGGPRPASTAARCTSTSWSTPRSLGGVRVEIGDDVIDGTVASRLDDARRRLAG